MMQRTRYLLRCIQHTRNTLRLLHVSSTPHPCLVLTRHLTTSPVCCHMLDPRDSDHEDQEKQLIVQKGMVFDEVERKERNKQTFQLAVHKYRTRHDKYYRGSVEFIYAALARMKDFNVHKDLKTYKQILNIMPTKKMVSKTAWQVEMMHYPKQQQCSIDLMDQMEMYGVVPDDEFGYLLKDMFGLNTYAFRKYQRMMYWMPKFKYINPYPMPFELPEDPVALARLALERMSVDPRNKILDFETTKLNAEELDVIDDTFVVSAQSPDQAELLADHDPEKPVFVQGGFTVWLRHKSLTYFILRADTTETYKVYTTAQNTKQDEFEYFKDFLQDIPFFNTKPNNKIMKQPSVHEQDDGTVLAMCITGTGSKNSLASWIKWLQDMNPQLKRVPVIFQLATPESGLTVIKTEEDRLRELGADLTAVPT